jgi:hypothetical protein
MELNAAIQVCYPVFNVADSHAGNWCSAVKAPAIVFNSKVKPLLVLAALK